MTRRAIDPLPEDPRDAPARYYERLVPLVEVLVQAGNGLLNEHGDRGFIPQPDGYNAYLTGPIDFDLLEREFEVPDDVQLDRERDMVVDRRTFATIYGSTAGQHFSWGR